MEKRNYGLDIARICAMCGIVMLHILGQGGVLANTYENELKYGMVWWLEICAYCSVDLFALLSGWLGIKKKRYSTYRTLELITIVICYCIVITLGFCLVFPGVFSSKMDIIKSMVPYLIGRYWYIICYIPIALLQPFFNKMLLILSENQHKQLCILSVLMFAVLPSIFNHDYFAINSGYSFTWLSICYVIGAYLKRMADITDKENSDKTKNMFVFFVCSILLLIGKMSMDYIFNTESLYFIGYTSPITLLMAIIILLVMEKIEVRHCKDIVKKLSMVAFDVYVIHCHILIFDIIMKNCFKWIPDMPILLIPIIVICLSIVLYLILAIIGVFRGCVFEKVHLNEVLKKIALKTDDIIYNNTVNTK